MDPAITLELVGYAGSFIVLISLLMRSVVKLRIINSIGAIVFTVYAILIKSYPTAVMNAALVVVNIWFLVKVLRTKSLLSVQELNADDAAVTHFVRFYRNDIAKNFPDYDFAFRKDDTCYLVYADANPVGLLVGKVSYPDTLGVELDYACPSHRDCSVGTFLYGYLKEQGVRQMVAHAGVAHHDRYLRKMGFSKKSDRFVKNL